MLKYTAHHILVVILFKFYLKAKVYMHNFFLWWHFETVVLLFFALSKRSATYFKSNRDGHS